MFIFAEKVLFKYDVNYYKCSQCGFIQTEVPYWLSEAYQTPVSVYDVGMVQRSLLWKSAIERIIRKFFNPNSKFVDYGGGTGLLVRLMRDSGFDFYRYDPYSSNIFAQGFDVADLPDKKPRFELLTAFEVLEHLEQPLVAIEEMFQLSDSILFSTLLQPSDQTKINPQDWAYFAQQTGQHISFYTQDALAKIAKKFDCNLYTNNENAHLLTVKKLNLTSNKINKLLYPTRLKIFYEFIANMTNSIKETSPYTTKDYIFICNKNNLNDYK
jgi:2-polyprenyl-3-methyl-5-hydroxy-6-metoxy-1,4-benzoquinol methylase